MGCASSGPLPFLSNRGNEAVADAPRVNGELPYEVKTMDNRLRENGEASVKDVNEKMSDVVDSTVDMVEDVVEQVEGFPVAAAETLPSAADSVEQTMESPLENLTAAVDPLEDKLSTEVTSKGDKTTSEEIDELLDSLPTEEEMTEGVKVTGEEGAEGDEVKGGEGE